MTMKGLSGLNAERKARSDAYQFKFHEIPVEDSILLEQEATTTQYDEKKLEYKEQLIERFWTLVDEHLTPKQAKVLKLTAQGLTQMEIAKQMNNKFQISFASMYGTCNYSRGSKNGKRYGGSVPKIQKILANDTVIQELLELINEK